MTIEKLIEAIRNYNQEADLALLQAAYDFAAEAHKGQVRKSGEDFITHPLGVAEILAELQLDIDTIVAALLHDVVEDTSVSLEDLDRFFGPDISSMVDGVTKLGRLEYRSQQEQQAENLRKMFLAMARDIRVILIKLADRLHNMRTLKHQPGEKQKEIAQETLEIFAPLAHRLGIFRLKWELEDLSLRFLQSEDYYGLVQSIVVRRLERERYLEEVIGILQPKLLEAGIRSDIQGRPKHFYSIYNKMHKQGKDLAEIYDLVAVRVILDSVRDCYETLGVIHALWKPIPGRFKDYIAMPKPNMYQSLHTTVIGPNGEPFEVQIRTWEMHRTAEYGIAAHWRYKEGGKPGDREFEEKLSWLRQVLEWQRETRDAKEFMESLKIDLFSDRVYVFTPKGDVVELPAGSVPLDFAYKVHTMVGHSCIGSKVNSRIVPLDYRLQTGDIVEILTSKAARPSRDWLNLVQTSQAKNRIRTYFRRVNREPNIARGIELLEREVSRQGLDPAILRPASLADAARRFNMTEADDVYAAIGDGAITALQVISRLKGDTAQAGPPVPAENLPIPQLKPWIEGRKPSQGVVVREIDNVMVHLAHCCNPLPGDDIIGYVTRGRGVSAHRRDCPNSVHHLMSEAGRLIDVAWSSEAEGHYQVQLEAVAMDRSRLTTDIMTAVADAKTVINAVNARATRNNLATVHLKVEIRNLEHLEYIIEKIKRIKDVLEVRRVTPISSQKS